MIAMFSASRTSMQQRLPQWSPFDVRIVLRLIAFLLAWKFVSLDYSGLVDVVGQRPLHPLTHAPLQALAGWLHVHIAGQALLVRELQVIAAIALMAGAWLAWRSLVLIGLAIVASIYLPAVQYSLWFYNVEFCWMMLVIAVVWPGSWQRVFNANRDVSGGSTAIGAGWTVYLAVAYFFCGWSKIAISWRWFLDTDLELLLPIMQVCHGSSFNWLGITEQFHHLLMTCPWLGQACALITLLAELGWCLTLVSPRARRLFPLLMFATHVGIFLASGILFLPLALLQIAVVIRWRDCFMGQWQASLAASWRSYRNVVPNPSVTLVGVRGLVPVTIAFFVVIYPALNHVNTGLLCNWNQFGWTYRAFSQPATYACLGYQDRTTGEVERLPLNHAGFMDFRGVTGPGEHLRNIVFSDNRQLVEQSTVSLKTYLLLVRGGHSNRWLLGPLACPSHVVCSTPKLSTDRFRELVVLQGKFHFDKSSRNLVGAWHPSTDLPIVSIERIDMLRTPIIAHANH